MAYLLVALKGFFRFPTALSEVAMLRTAGVFSGIAVVSTEGGSFFCQEPSRQLVFKSS